MYTAYELKAIAIEKGLNLIERKTSRKMYEAWKNDNYDLLNQLQDIREEYKKIDPELWRQAIKINNNSYARASRLEKRLTMMLCCGRCKFVTLTFSPKYLCDYGTDYRRRVVREFLKSQSDYYVANIDFGSENEREHYHAVVMLPEGIKDIDFKNWIYGYYWVNTIPLSGDISHFDNLLRTSGKISHYVDKLVNHAIKETTKRQHAIYGRGKLSNLENKFETLLKNR